MKLNSMISIVLMLSANLFLLRLLIREMLIVLSKLDKGRMQPKSHRIYYE